MSELERISREYDSKVKELQETCPHKEASEWVEVTPMKEGYTEYYIRTCKRCGKLLDEKLFGELSPETRFLLKCTDAEKKEVSELAKKLGIDTNLAAKMYVTSKRIES